MSSRRSLLVVCFLACLVGHARAADPLPEALPPESCVCTDGACAVSHANMLPTMYGDFVGPGVNFYGNSPAAQRARATVQIPLAARAGYKIAENEGAAPDDRFFLTGNYYNNLNPSVRPAGLGVLDYDRTTIGFEKTFWDGDGSFGLRLPVFHLTGDPDVEKSEVGDLTLIGKFALLNDRTHGNVVSTGLALTLPTGKELHAPKASAINPVLFQPYVGGAWMGSNLFAQGFSSLTVPFDRRDAVIWFNDLQLGVGLVRDRDNFLSALWPVFEVHVATPLSQRGLLHQPVGVPDTVDLTLGTTFVFKQCCYLNVGVCTPVTGPRPFAVEGIGQFNVRF